jgi:predicted enzyme related to lactoylglutathione lyase
LFDASRLSRQILHRRISRVPSVDFDGALARIESSRAIILEGPMVNHNAGHREIGLRDPNGCKVVVAARYGDIDARRINALEPNAAGDARNM